MNCKVKNCRFSDLHNTWDHQCGKCRFRGHGQIECDDYRAKNALCRIIEDELYPKVVPYESRHIHKTVLSPGIMVERISGIKDKLQIGDYSMCGMGMGCCCFMRRTPVQIEYIFLHDTDDQNITSSRLLQEFVNGYSPVKRVPPPNDPTVYLLGRYG